MSTAIRPLVALALCVALCACTGRTSERIEIVNPAPPSQGAPPTESAPPTQPATPVAAPDSPEPSEGDPVPTDTTPLAAHRGTVLLVVNVASECGFTPQYAGLQTLHAELADQGFSVIAFPSNEFGGQEPGDLAQIQEFCSTKFGVTFPVEGKVQTKAGDGQSTVYTFLTEAAGAEPNWNFCKYLVGRDGQVLGFYKSPVKPDDAELRKAIDAAIAAPR